MTALTKLDLGVLGSVGVFLLGLSASQVMVLQNQAVITTEITHIKEAAKDRYTATQAENDKKLQELRDSQQDARIISILDKQNERANLFEKIRERLTELEIK